jgi:Putative prokaryotic signal transducing protein
MEEPIPVTSVMSRFEGDMVCDLLRTAGLQCGMARTTSDSAYAGLLAGQIEIFVHEADLEAAREVLAEADSR